MAHQLDNGTSRAPSLFVSPHFDDVVLSCGGTIALEARRGGAIVLTVFAGEAAGALNPFAEFQHQRWGLPEDALAERHREDAAAMAVLGASRCWLDYPDAIYRDNLYLSDDELFGTVKPEDEGLARAVAESVAAVVADVRPERVYLPLAVGNHVDHQICFAAAARIESTGVSLLFYEDFPYAVTTGAVEERVKHCGRAMTSTIVPIGETIEQRIVAIRCYASQVPTVFRHHGPAEDVVRAYATSVGGTKPAERFWCSEPAVDARQSDPAGERFIPSPSEKDPE